MLSNPKFKNYFLTVPKYFSLQEDAYIKEDGQSSLYACVNEFLQKPENVREILAFQMMLAFFDNEMGVQEGTEFFEFSNTIHKGTQGRTLGQKGTNKVKSSSEDGGKNNNSESNSSKIVSDGVNNMGQTDPSIDSYKIVIKPKSSIVARFNIDYPIFDTPLFENITKIFKQRFKRGIAEQLVDIAGQICRREDWNKADSNNMLFSNMTEDNIVDETEDKGNLYLYDQLQEWHKKFSNRKRAFPIENIQMLYNIGRTLEKRSVHFSKERYYSVLSGIYDFIAVELEKRDDFYEIKTDSMDSYVRAYREYPFIEMFTNTDNADIFQRYLEMVLLDRNFSDKNVVDTDKDPLNQMS